MSALFTLYNMRESLLASLRGAFAAAGQAGAGAAPAGRGGAENRLDRDIPLKWIVISIGVLLVPIAFIYYHFTRSIATALIASLVLAATGFVLSAIGGYLVGLMGSSNQPVSGLTLAALVVAALLMVMLGVRGLPGVAAVLGVASVVCIACSVAGSLIQDLKAGHLLGGTPWKMQVAEAISVAALAFFLMVPFIVLHRTYVIGSEKLSAPQANLMALLAQGIVGGEMAWGLVLMGLLFGLVLIMIDAPAPMLIAVGMYLPLETTGAIFVGGMFKLIADRVARAKKLSPAGKEAYEQRGTLLASGLIAGEALLAILLSLSFIGAEQAGIRDFTFTRWLTGRDELAIFREHGAALSLIVFAVVGYVLVRVPFRKGLPE
jgi:putative OPT family oligopeptide transporter